MKIEYFQTIRKRVFAEILENVLTAGHLVFLRPLAIALYIATALDKSKIRQFILEALSRCKILTKCE